MPHAPEEVGARIRAEREKAGLSVSQLADQAGLSKAYLVRVENARANPSLQVLGQIADALDITVADLVGGPVLRYQPEDEEIPASLLAFADEENLTRAERRTLASIRFRKGDEPRTSERWRYIYNSLRLSRSLDPDPDEEDLD